MHYTFHKSPNHASAKKLAELATQLARLSSDMVELASGLLAESVMSNQDSPNVQADNRSTAAPESRRKPASKDEVIASVKAARDVIGQHNQPIQVGVLFKEISAKGFIINTPRPVLTYAARLRDNRKRVGLIYLDGFGWWPVERPYPPAQYMPSSISRIGKHIV
jgi:hypothetical protein